MNYLPPASRVAAQVRLADRWISRIAAATVAGLAGVAGALSYSHMRQLAQGHGQAGWHAHAFPLSVDGVEIVASLVLLAANIATAHPDPVSRVIAGWPAIALLLAVKLLSGILERRHAPRVRVAVAGKASQVIEPTAPATPSHGTMLTGPGEPPADADPAEIRPGSAEPLGKHPSSSPKAADPALDGRTAALLPAARAAGDALRYDGQTLTRDALAARLREHGHPIRNASVTPLLRQLRHEQPTHLAA